MKQVYDFEVKWLGKFRNEEIDYRELVDPHIAEDCDALRLHMD